MSFSFRDSCIRCSCYMLENFKVWARGLSNNEAQNRNFCASTNQQAECTALYNLSCSPSFSRMVKKKGRNSRTIIQALPFCMCVDIAHTFKVVSMVSIVLLQLPVSFFGRLLWMPVVLFQSDTFI